MRLHQFVRAALACLLTGLASPSFLGCSVQPGRELEKRDSSSTEGEPRDVLARWTPPDIDYGESTLWTPELMLRDGCLGFRDARGDVLLVFPYGEGEWDADTGTLAYKDESYRAGDDVMVLGDFATPQYRVITEHPHSLAGCSFEHVFLIGWSREPRWD